MNRAYVSGTLQRHLPAIHHGSPALTELLGVLEMLLLHCEDEHEAPALGDHVAAIPALFTPLPIDDDADDDASTVDAALATTPDAFLPWLATWVGLGRRTIDLLIDDESPSQQRAHDDALRHATLRRVIAEIVPLYAMRGTAVYLERMLKLLLPAVERVDIDDRDLPGLRLSMSELGRNAWLVSHRPFHFRIAIGFAKDDGQRGPRKRRERALRRHAIEIVELSKPAHTTYDATWDFA